jgi:hypothetical protein
VHPEPSQGEKKMRKPVLLLMAGALLALAVGFVGTPPADAG